MSRQISVHLLPVLFEPEDVRGSIAVIVDILRASTTISHALASGADGVVPCLSVEDAIQLRDNSEPGTCLLGGERGGVKIDGFDLSNSPDDYLSETVQGKTIGFTTTNGTKALLRCELAERILVGAFVNYSAVLNQLISATNPVHIVCAGTDGVITGEDVLFAGALVAALRIRDPDRQYTDQAIVAESHWITQCGDPASAKIQPAMRQAQGGRNLIRLGYDKDIATAARVDSVSEVGVVTENRVIRCSQT